MTSLRSAVAAQKLVPGKPRGSETSNSVADRQVLDPQKSFGYQVRRCHRSFDRLLAYHLAQRGLKTGFWYYLRVLWIRDGVTQKHLSDMTNVAENTTVSMIDGMVNSGLVTRERNPDDRREMRVSLTTKGRRLQSGLIGHAIGINRIATQGIDPDELNVCLSVLSRMSVNLLAELERIETPG
jgi:DNA-binding MarR family transcriptional regulator